MNQQKRVFSLHLKLSVAILAWIGLTPSVRATPTFPIVNATGAATASVDLAAATTALENGDFTTAVKAYESVANGGHVNGHLFYNLGIAYFRTGRTGEAMAAFLAARRYLPRDPDVAANLRFVLATTKDKLEAEADGGMRVAPLQAVLTKVTARELAIAAAACMTLSGLAVLLTLLVPAWAAWQRRVWLTALVPCAALALLAVKLSHAEVWGAVVAVAGDDGESSDKVVSVHSGPAAAAKALFELREGAPVLIRERGNAGYLRIQLSDGKSGWIAGSQVKVFGAPFGALL